MFIKDKETRDFLRTIKSFMADENDYLLPVNDSKNIDPDKVLLGYYDDQYLTAISSVLFYILYFSFNMFYFLPTLLNPFVLFRNGYKLYLVFGGTEDGSLYLPIAGIYPMIFSAVVITILSLAGSKILRKKMNGSI